jgi:glycosyltransferase involved in cell wall biosynthesis
VQSTSVGHSLGAVAPLVSIITIFLNAEPFLEEAIESVFAQTYPAWELLLVDDGSNDASRRIALRYMEEHPGKVRLLEHAGGQNRGMSASRNLAIAQAKGEFIAFLDADDTWLPNKLEHQMAIFESQPDAAMVYGRTQWWYSWNHNAEDQLGDYIHELGVPANTLLQPPILLIRFLQAPEFSPCTCSALIRRNVVEQVGGFEESFRGLYEDQAFFAKVCLFKPIFVSSECSARYRQHPNSNCSIMQKSSQYAGARSAFLKWLASYFSNHNMSYPAVWKALRSEMWPCRHPSLNRVYQRARRGPPGRIWRSIQSFKTSYLSLPLVRNLRCIQLRRLTPVRNGKQSGTPIVRYYWERYLHKHRSDIRGIALEIGTTSTIRRLAGRTLACAEAIDLSAHNPEVTIVADLSRADDVPSNRYDCFVNQFTMHLIYDAKAALYHSIRIL